MDTSAWGTLWHKTIRYEGHFGIITLYHNGHFEVRHFGIGHFGVAHFGVRHFGMGHFGVAHFGVGHFGMGHFGVGHLGVGQFGVRHFTQCSTRNKHPAIKILDYRGSLVNAHFGTVENSR